jgi:hypothetical protein
VTCEKNARHGAFSPEGSLLDHLSSRVRRVNEPLDAAYGTIWNGGTEPDVPWGIGGIDDWGWTSVTEIRELERRMS